MARSSNVHWHQHESSASTTTSGRSHGSDSNRSYDTTATDCSGSSSSSYRPPLARRDTCNAAASELPRRDHHNHHDHHDHHHYPQPPSRTPPVPHPARSSVDTYASTSEEEVADDLDFPEYDVPQYTHEPLPVDAIPTTPRDFADLFPTAKRISIRHDDSTIDGNMNLRVDTQVEERHNRKQNYTLFHLRMHDLRTREFSLRRYCRDSGREVCHSIRKYQKPPAEKRPVLQRASTALASFRHKPDSRPSTAAGLKRSDSGYESIRGMVGGSADDDLDGEDDCRPKSVGYSKGRALMPTNTLKLEFSNYAHIDVKRRGAKSNKRYTFEYWGHDYSWKRIVKKERDHETVSYYLVRADNEKEPLAHICPVRLDPDEADEEKARGGWIPPCYMRMTDDRVLNPSTDISDVVIATGLMALVDDCIKRRFHSKQNTQLHIPLMRTPSFKMNMEYIGPKRLIDEVFHRNTKQPSTLRRTSVEA